MSLSSQIVFFVFFIDEELRLVLSKFTHLLFSLCEDEPDLLAESALLTKMQIGQVSIYYLLMFSIAALLHGLPN